MTLLLGAAQGFFLALLLFERKRNQTANRMLDFLVAFYSVYLLGVAFYWMNYQLSFPQLIGVTEGLPYLFGPLHYLYARLLNSPGRRLEKRDWLHFLPFVIFKAYMLPFLLSSAPEKLRFMQNMDEAGKPFALICLEWAMILQGNVYMILSLRQRVVLSGDVDLTRVPKYQKSGPSLELAENYLRRLRQFMETKKLFTKNDLTLNKLAERLAIPAHHLSQIINDRLQQNFYDLVNNYRVEEAKKRLLDPAYQHLTILAIGYEVGFSSKSVFNKLSRR